MDVGRIPMTHGMEIEQFDLPNEISQDPEGKYWGTWEHDPSGPREIEIGPGKHVKRLIGDFNETARQYGRLPWVWASSNGSSGAGSHVHFNVDNVDDEETTIKAWTIAYNTIVDLLPVLSPFFCHNWEEGFRDGTDYDSSQTNVEHWASPVTARYDTDSMRQYYQRPDSFSRAYDAITANPSDHTGKPLTLELRLSDSHPVFALTGSYYLRKTVKRCFDRDWSVKIDRQASQGINIVREMYDRIYHIPDGSNLINELQRPLRIEFEDGREVPNLDSTYACPYDLLEDILIEITPRWGEDRADRRASNLVRYAGDLVRSRRSDPFVENVSRIPCPSRNERAIWHMDTEQFSWQVGPD